MHYNFLAQLERFPKNAKICFDYQYKRADMNGLILARKLYAAGYPYLYMFSGTEFEPYQLPPYLKFYLKGEAVANFFWAL